MSDLRGTKIYIMFHSELFERGSEDALILERASVFGVLHGALEKTRHP